jgi:hypothetical protein
MPGAVEAAYHLDMGRAALLLGTLLVGCESAAPGGSGADSGVPAFDSGALPFDSGVRPAPTLTGLDLLPPRAELISTDGSRPTQNFVVIGRYSDGSTVAVTAARFTVDPYPLGNLDGTGLFTASGAFGGRGRVRAEYAGYSADAELIVRLEHLVLGAGVPNDVAVRFSGAPTVDPARAAQLVYPLDGAVMPQNVPPAEVQWSASAENDLYQVTLVKPHVSITAYLLADAGFRDAFLPETNAWRRLTTTDPDESAVIQVNRLEAATGTLLSGTPVSVRFARAALTGSIYYWDIVAGRIVRIDDGTTNRQNFMPNPPQGCVGCHSVSRSGRYMAGRFGGGDNVGSVMDLTLDLSPNPPPLQFALEDTRRWWFSSWSPDDTRLVVSRNENTGGNSSLVFLDPVTGAFIDPIEGTMPTGYVTHPDWAPDGSAIAYVANVDTWGGQNLTGDLFLLPMLGVDRVGPSQPLIAGTAVIGVVPTGAAASYPSWSPDSTLIAFAHGTSSRSETGLSALYGIKKDGTGLIRLSKASGGPAADLSFQPRFSPFRQGGYYWMSFLSRRDYGNAKAGTAGTSRQQIWVSAVKEGANPGEDPSEVAYWLPGQDPASLNISAYWAPRPCRAAGSGCSVSSECCSGDCALDQAGAQACTEAPPPCKEFGEACGGDGECCSGVLCVAGTCGSL